MAKGMYCDRNSNQNLYKLQLNLHIVTENGQSEKRWSKLSCDRSAAVFDRLFWSTDTRSGNFLINFVAEKIDQKIFLTDFETIIFGQKAYWDRPMTEKVRCEKISDRLSDRNFGHKRVQLVKTQDACLFWLNLLQPIRSEFPSKINNSDRIQSEYPSGLFTPEKKI